MNDVAGKSFEGSRGFATTGGVFKEVPKKEGALFKFYLNDYKAKADAMAKADYKVLLADEDFYRWLYVEVVPVSGGRFGFRYSDKP